MDEINIVRFEDTRAYKQANADISKIIKFLEKNKVQVNTSKLLTLEVDVNSLYHKFKGQIVTNGKDDFNPNVLTYTEFLGDVYFQPPESQVNNYTKISDKMLVSPRKSLIFKKIHGLYILESDGYDNDDRFMIGSIHYSTDLENKKRNILPLRKKEESKRYKFDNEKTHIVQPIVTETDLSNLLSAIREKSTDTSITLGRISDYIRKEDNYVQKQLAANKVKTN